MNLCNIYKRKKKAIIISVCAIAAGLLIALAIWLLLPMYNYYSAEGLIEEKKYAEAYEALLNAEDFKDAEKLREKFRWVPLSETSTYSNINGVIETVYEYDGKGNCTRQISTNSDGNQSILETSYDSHGNRTKVVITDPYETKTVEYSYVYEGNLVKEMTVTNKPGDVVVSKYTYDKNGCCIKAVSIFGDGTENVETTQFGKNSLPVKRHIVLGRGYEETTAYEYDKDGNCTKETTTTKDGAVKKTVIFSYDEYGSLLSKTETDEDGATEKTICQLDRYKNCTKKTVERKNGDITETETYTYKDYKVYYLN